MLLESRGMSTTAPAGAAALSPPGTREICVVVLGLPRSGTSILAGLIHVLGVRMSPRDAKPDWMGVRPSSPTGSYENPNFTGFNWTALGLDARRPLSSLPDDWRERLARVRSEEVASLVAEADGGVWGWKDPHTVLTLPLYFPHVRNPRFVVVRRNPADVVRSIHRQDWATLPEAARLVRIMVEELAADLDRFRDVPRLELEFDDVTLRPERAVDELVAFLGLRSTPRAREEAVALVRTKADQFRATKRLAVAELTRTPKWLGYYVMLEVRQGPPDPKGLIVSAWNRFVQTFRLATSS